MRSVGIYFIYDNGTVTAFILCPSLQFLVALIAPIALIGFVVGNIFRVSVLGRGGNGIVVDESDALIRYFPIFGIHQILLHVAFIDAVVGFGKNTVSADIARRHPSFQVIGFAYFRIAHIQFQNTESGGEIGILPIHIDIIDGLVVGERLRIIVGDILYVVVIIQQVYIIIGIDDDELLDRRIPGDECDARIRE